MAKVRDTVRTGGEAGSESKRTGHVAWLDGIRGLAAFYVVLGHVYVELDYGQARCLTPAMNLLTAWTKHGHYAVAVFIVLSGYCLMLPVARAPDGQLRGGAWAYLGRRAKRILPAYYASLLMALALMALIPAMRNGTGTGWDLAIPNYTPKILSKTLISHLLLVHNLRWEWIYKINPPTWSVATEWQIYFALPLLLLPVWRRWGLVGCCSAAVLAGIAPAVLRPGRYDLLCPWYLGLFGFGMAGAMITTRTGGGSVEEWLRRKMPWGWLTVGLALGGVLAHCGMAGKAPVPQWLVADTLLGVAAASMIVYCSRVASSMSSSQARPTLYTLPVWIFGSRAAVALGGFSYSLYLIHVPLLSVAHHAMRCLGMGPWGRLLTLYLVVVPLIVAASYGFYRLFERPFMQSSRNKVRRQRCLTERISAMVGSDNG
ncbi:MAG: acyltransferase [Phycisphaerales bacterium]|nr:acyltransferase [Phycisphaerales bacterium]